jgi:hypothetical protein
MEAEAARHPRNRRKLKAAVQTETSPILNIRPSKEVVTRNFFATLRAADMDNDASGTETTRRQVLAKQVGRLQIILTFTTKMIQLQTQLKSVLKENFDFRSTRNGTRVITRATANFQSVKSHIDANNLSYYSFYPKSEKPMKAVIRHLPHNNPAEDISEGLVSLGFDVISFKQITATRRSPSDESITINLPLFLITLPRTA